MKSPHHLERFADLTWQDLDEWAGSTIVSRGESYKKRVVNLCLAPEGSLVAAVAGA